MSSHERINRAPEIIAREAAQFITEEASGDSLITVIRAQSMARGSRVLVFISVFPESKIRPALSFLGRHRGDFSNYLKSHTRLRPLPRIDFLPDNLQEDIAPTDISRGQGGN